MELKELIGKTVINAQTQKRYQLFEVTSPLIEIIDPTPNEHGVCKAYRYPTINGDPFSTGVLVFEDATLLEPFKGVPENPADLMENSANSIVNSEF